MSSQIAIDSLDDIYVGWEGHNIIFVKKSTDGGINFGQVTNISAPKVDEMNMAVYLNNTYVTWRTDAQNDEIFLVKSTDGGINFGQVTNISNTQSNSYNHDLAVYGNNVFGGRVLRLVLNYLSKKVPTVALTLDQQIKSGQVLVTVIL